MFAHHVVLYTLNGHNIYCSPVTHYLWKIFLLLSNDSAFIQGVMFQNAFPDSEAYHIV